MSIAMEIVYRVIDSGGDLAPNLGGTETVFRGPRFLNEFFPGKISIFTAKISYDLFVF